MNKILFISDIHFGSPLLSSERKIRLAEILTEDWDFIYLNGDIFDSWENNLENIYRTNKWFFEFIINNKSKIKYVIGNHDHDLEELKLYLPEEIFISEDEIILKINDKERKIKIVHGQEFDKLTTSYDWLMKSIFIFQWLSERICKYNLQAKVREWYYKFLLKDAITFDHKKLIDSEVAAIKKYKSNYDGIIMGHNHYPNKINADDFIYFNSGDLIYNFSYVYYKNNQITLVNEKNNFSS